MRYRELYEVSNEDDFDDDDAFNAKYDDDDDSKYDHLPSIKVVEALRPKIAAAAQEVYDNWVQDEHDDLNGGGICHLIAEEVANIVSSAGVPVSTQCSTYEQHVYCVCQVYEGIFEVDIPYRTYEHGAGFTWTKIPDVQFTTDYVTISRLDSDPGRMNQYVEEWED